MISHSFYRVRKTEKANSVLTLLRPNSFTLREEGQIKLTTYGLITEQSRKFLQCDFVMVDGDKSLNYGPSPGAEAGDEEFYVPSGMMLISHIFFCSS